MKFIMIITRSERKQNGETVELKREKFEAPSIRAAKAHATKIANALVFLEGKICWDGVQDIIGKDLRWKMWDMREPYEQKNGKRVGWSGKIAERLSGNYDPKTDTCPSYYVWVTLYWELVD